MTRPLEKNIRTDVVTVPDFCSPGTAFEARTLLFLASWIETDAGREAELTLACIGDPPPSVRRLAEHAGARIEVFGPSALPIGAFGNKLRGFETTPRSTHLWLVDVDTCLLNAPRWDELAADRISIMPAAVPLLGEADWRKVYSKVGGTLPDHRIPSTVHECLGAAARDEVPSDVRDQVAAMIPYYNSGSIRMPRTSRLPGVWERHAGIVHTAFLGDPSVKRNVPFSDQVTMATALQEVLAGGEKFQPLPLAWNGVMLGLRSGALRYDEVILLHMIGSLRKSVPPRLLTDELAKYLDAQSPALAPDVRKRLADHFHALYSQHIEPVLG